MKIAICQINPSLGDFENNKIKILEYANKAMSLDANIIIFPELSICGYPPMDLIWESDFIEQNNKALKEVASVSSIPMIIGCLRSDDDKIYNSAAICYEKNYRNIAIKFYFQIMMSSTKKDFLLLDLIQRQYLFQ